jgi:hypothetical protein
MAMLFVLALVGSGCATAVISKPPDLKQKIITVREDELFDMPASTNHFGRMAGRSVSITGAYSGSTPVLETGGMMHFGVPSVTEVSLRKNHLHRKTYSFEDLPRFQDGALVEVSGVIKGGGRFVYPIAELYAITPASQKIASLTNEVQEARRAIETQFNQAGDVFEVNSLQLSSKQRVDATKSIPVNLRSFLGKPVQFYAADLSATQLVFTLQGPSVNARDDRNGRHLYLYVVYDFGRHEIKKAFVTILIDFIWLE